MGTNATPAPWSMFVIMVQGRRNKKREVSCLEVGRSPLFVLLGQLSLHPGDGDGGPDTGPEEGENPTELQVLLVTEIVLGEKEYVQRRQHRAGW
jgi:hypothetical protein